MSDIENREDVILFVNSFYGKVQEDDLIGPIFASRIKDWGPHLERMYGFWSSILLATGEYRGQPFPKHLGLHIRQEHFDRWLGLFEANMNELFTGPRADEALHRSKTIAQIFSHKIDMLEGEQSLD